MAYERNAQFTIRSETRLMSLAAAWSDGGVPHQTAKLGRALTKGRIAKRLLDHPTAVQRSLV